MQHIGAAAYQRQPQRPHGDPRRQIAKDAAQTQSLEQGQ